MDDGWQPINTAPKDGTTILAAQNNKRKWSVALLHYHNGWWRDELGRLSTPTHWLFFAAPTEE